MSFSETKTTQRQIPAPIRLANSYYGLLGLHPSASVIEIRRSYRELSKLYHPDTTKLPPEEAILKFQQLNEAYGTLSNPERRSLYDLKIGYSRINVIQSNLNLQKPESNYQSNSAYLDASDRPLSGGELFALSLIGVTFLGCILVVIRLSV
jgi:curved DNA-binding protein CbpA